MRLLVLCVLALVACACVGVRAQDNNPDQRISCFPCTEEHPSCPVVRPSQCRSGKLYHCGCCDTCQVNLEDGDWCRGFVETNGVCVEPMTCIGNICHYPRPQPRHHLNLDDVIISNR